MASPAHTPSELDRALNGDVRALARLLSLVEDGSPRVREVIKDLLPRTGHARIIGLTGAPGVGKSTLTAALVGAFRAAGRRIAVLAVDPTSPFTGGALLGDRIRMQEHATDEAVFIRSMASRGHLGGLAAARVRRCCCGSVVKHWWLTRRKHKWLTRRKHTANSTGR